jgi:ABC-type glycerol-3-phosphate transport system substrate-binding protein
MKKLSPRLQRFLKTGYLAGLLGVVGIMATGCGTDTATTSTASEFIQVRIWRVGQAPQDNDALSNSISEMKRIYRGKKIDVSFTPRGLATYEEDAIKSLAARKGPEVWSIPSDWLGDHIPRITALPQNYFYQKDAKGVRATTGPDPVSEIRRLYPQGIAEQLISADGKQVYGLPTEADTLRLYFNNDLFQQAYQDYRKTLGNNPAEEDLAPVRQLFKAAPTTWLDVVEMTKYLTKPSEDGNSFDRSGIALGTTANIPNANEAVQLLMMQNGADIVSSDRRNALYNAPITTPSGTIVNPGTLALDFFLSFANPEKETYTWNKSMPSAVEAFAQGKVAMVVGFSDFEKELRTKFPKFRSYATAPVPQNSVTEKPVNFLRFNIETVTKTAKSTEDRQASFAFLELYTTTNQAQQLATRSGTSNPFTAAIDKRKASDKIAAQIPTAKGVYKQYREQFDAAFKAMIDDSGAKRVTSTVAVDRSVQVITGLLQRTDRL